MFGAPTELPMGPPSTETASPYGESGAGGEDPVAYAKQALEAVQAAMQAEPDEEDTHALAKIVALLQGYVASQAKLMDQTLGAPDLARVLRKTA